MDNYRREYPRLSACGLNCGLCPRYYTEGSSKCPGCGGENFFDKHPPCGVLSCSRKKNLEYCCFCEEYPCKKYENAGWDSFITHKNMFKDFDKFKKIGFEAYRKELDEKVDILEWLFKHCNDGRRKNFYCIAVNLLDLATIRIIMNEIKSETEHSELDLKENTKLAVQKFQKAADERNIILKLNKKIK